MPRSKNIEGVSDDSTIDANRHHYHDRFMHITEYPIAVWELTNLAIGRIGNGVARGARALLRGVRGK